MTSLRSIAAFVLALAFAGDAHAVGAVLSTAEEPATVAEARFAIAISRSQTTRWAQLRVERFPGAMAWLLPVRPGARVAEVTDAWFEALEVATAPRVVAPRCGDGAAPEVHVERSTVHEPTAPAVHVTPVDDVAALRTFAHEWALELPPETATRFEALEARGFAFVAMVYAGSADRTLTRTVRVTDDSFPAVPLFLTSGPASKKPVRVAAFLVADSRARVGVDAERELDPGIVSFSDAGTTNYENALVADLMAHGGKSWIVEAADHAFFFDGVRGPAGAGTSAPFVTTYVDRSRAYGDASDDLDLALSGLDPSTAWITRVAGIVPAREFGDDLAVTMVSDSAKNPFLVVRSAGSCSVPAPDAGSVVPPMMPPGVDAGRPRIDPPPPGTTTGAGTTTGGGPIIREGTPQGTYGGSQASVSCSCSPGADDGTPSDSCGRSESDGPSSDDGCDGSASSSDDSSDDGCDGSSSDGSDDGGGCDGGGGGDDSSDGCASDTSGDSSGSGSGCDSGSSSGGDTKCGVARHRRRGRPRTSAYGFALCALLLPLRRLTRPRR
jgi:hypothetical protein